MILRFTIENFLSFGEETVLSMMPGKSRSHKDHVFTSGKKKDIDFLKIALVYGANASGKSNLIKGLHFLSDFVNNGTKPDEEIRVTANRLVRSLSNKPSKLEVEFRKGGYNYAFGVVADRHRVVEEWLYEVTKYSEKMVYERKSTQSGETSVSFGKSLLGSAKEKSFLDFLGSGTRVNQLFLTECSQRNLKSNVRNARPILNSLDWFKDTLVIVFPDSRYGGLELQLKEDEAFRKSLTNYLKAFDTAIDAVGLTRIDFKKIVEIPEKVKEDILKELKPGSRILVNGRDDSTFLISKGKDNRIPAYKVMVSHGVTGSKERVEFDLRNESDGTQRLVDLIPALMYLAKTEKVFVIDELDRSLHPLLSMSFLEAFLKSSANNCSQVLVTTHESQLLDLKRFRKDEIWFVEKLKDNQSKLYSLDEFRVRFDKRIRADYLLGRFGAIPTPQKRRF